MAPAADAPGALQLRQPVNSALMSVTDLPNPLIDYASVFRALLPLNMILVLGGFIAS